MNVPTSDIFAIIKLDVLLRNLSQEENNVGFSFNRSGVGSYITSHLVKLKKFFSRNFNGMVLNFYYIHCSIKFFLKFNGFL